MAENIKVVSVGTSPNTQAEYEKVLEGLQDSSRIRVQEIVDWEAGGKPEENKPEDIKFDDILPVGTPERASVDAHIEGIRESVRTIQSAQLLLENGLI